MKFNKLLALRMMVNKYKGDSEFQNYQKLITLFNFKDHTKIGTGIYSNYSLKLDFMF